MGKEIFNEWKLQGIRGELSNQGELNGTKGYLQIKRRVKEMKKELTSRESWSWEGRANETKYKEETGRLSDTELGVNGKVRVNNK